MKARLGLLFFLAICDLGLGQSDQASKLQSVLAAAQQAQAAGQYTKAAAEYREAVTIRPDIPELWANLGLMQHESENYVAAIQSFEKANRLKPSLYVPSLFLGIDYERIDKAKDAVPFLLKAEKIQPADVQAPLALGRAYSSLGRFSAAAREFTRATVLDPKQSSAWFALGIANLDSVEEEARLLSAIGRNSPYAQALYAESLVKQSRYKQAEDIYKSLVGSEAKPPCLRSELGFLYLRERKAAEAESAFRTELETNPGCNLALLGQARIQIDAASDRDALESLQRLSVADAGFLSSNASILTEGMPPDESSRFLQVLLKRRDAEPDPNAAPNPDLYSLLSAAFGVTEKLVPEAADADAHANGLLAKASLPRDHTAEQYYAQGQYGLCAAGLSPDLARRSESEVQLLADCAFWTGKYQLASDASESLSARSPHSLPALYWSIRSRERLAFQALSRYQQLEPDSARSHLLLGDMYRQRGRFDDAQTEYKQALSLSPNNAAALIGLASAYFGDANLDQTIATARVALVQRPDDPELNLLMGEALVSRHEFENARPFLEKSLTTAKPQLLPHVHALLGKVYAEMGKTQDAIDQLKLGLVDDQDGSTHYQLARLYREVGDSKDADAAMQQVKVLVEQRRERAAVALEDSSRSNQGEEQ